MTAQTADLTTDDATLATGRVARVTGPVIDVEFPSDAIPDMYNALKVDTTIGGVTETLTLEVALHIGDGLIRAISLRPTDGIVRGATVTNTGGPITVPVGDQTLGKVFNTTGDVMNLKDGEKWEVNERWASTARRPRSTSSSPRPRCSRPASRSSTS